MVMSHKGSGFDFKDNTWTSPHSHLCQAGRAKVCRGGDQRPNTLSLKMFFIVFNEKYETNLPMRNHQNSGQHREVQTLSSWGARLKYSPIKQPSTIQGTGQYPRKAIIKPRKKWSEMLKVLSPWRARIIPPCREAWSVMSLVTGRFACWTQNWNDQQTSVQYQLLCQIPKAPAAQVHSWRIQHYLPDQQTLDSAEKKTIISLLLPTLMHTNLEKAASGGEDRAVSSIHTQNVSQWRF